MFTLIKWCSLQQNASKFILKQFYKIDP